jgi:MerR family mercuric resistance operon transcriptional regulator
MRKSRTYTIGKLAQAAEVTIETIRYYQRQKLIEEPSKPLQGYRQYPETTLKRLRFIKQAQKLGFTLKEIEELLFLDNAHCIDVQRLAEQKLKQIESQLEGLEALRETLRTMVKSCKAGQQSGQCSIIETLSDQI